MSNQNTLGLEDSDIFVLSSEKLQKHEPTPNKEAADFETAISATGFGKYNLLLILVAIPSGLSSIFDTTSMSYVFPAAQCDLDLSLNDKGSLNAITYIGMISSAFIWGYLCDTIGRKKLLVIGFFLDGLCILMSVLSQNFILLMVSKFLGGFIINGPFAALVTYLSEFHSSAYRAKVQMVLGFVFSSGTVILPLLAWLVLPLEINIEFNIFSQTLKLHSWNIYLLVCVLPPFIGGLSFIFLPESPKFLMTQGKNKEALELFKKVYRFNTGKPAGTFPIHTLIEEKKKEIKSNGSVEMSETEKFKNPSFKEGLLQMKPLFLQPLLPKLILVCLLQMLQMMSLNTIRLWMPQLFQAINDYQFLNNGTSASLCTMLSVIRPSKNATVEEVVCIVNTNNSTVYINAVIVSTTTLVGYVLVGNLINMLGKKRLLLILTTSAGIAAICIYFAQTTLVTLILCSAFVATNSICVNVLLAIVVDLFPTTLRTMTVSLTMMIGRVGAMSGNLIFPFLLKSGCAPPFFSVASVIICCTFFTLLLPNTDMKALI